MSHPFLPKRSPIGSRLEDRLTSRLTPKLDFGAEAAGVFRKPPYETGRVSQSAWFDGTDDRLSKTFASAATNLKEGIISAWVLRNSFSNTFDMIIDVDTAGRDFIGFNSSNKLCVTVNGSNWVSTPVFRDIGWYHMVASWDTSQGTATDRLRVWVNGSEITSWDSQGTITLNGNSKFFGTAAHYVGGGTAGQRFHGYVAQFTALNEVSIQQGDYAITDFGSFYSFSANGQEWTPLTDAQAEALAAGVGGNAFCLTNEIGDGVDASGNANGFTATNMSSSANGSDNTPSLQYPILNVLDRSDTGLATYAGGLGFTLSNAAAGFMRTTMGMYAGKFYSELEIDGLPTANWHWGITDADAVCNTSNGPSDGGVTITLNSSGTVTLYQGGASIGTLDTGVTDAAHTFMCAVDIDNGRIWFGMDGTWYSSGDPAAGTNETDTFATGLTYKFVVGRESSNATVEEQRLVFSDLSETVPSGFEKLNSATVLTPEHQGCDWFNGVGHTGDATTSRSFTGTGFQPDWEWIKDRSGPGSGNLLFDVLRGAEEAIFSQTTTVETNQPTNGYLTSFDSDGASYANGGSGDNNYNDNANTYIRWSWKAGGAGVANTDGTISSTVSVSAPRHLSIISFTGTGANATVGHGMGGSPELILFKNLDNVDNWGVYEGLVDGGTHYLTLDTSSANVADSTFFNNTNANSTVFSVGSQNRTNGSGDRMIAYAFRSVANVCKVGSYIGNGSTDGPFIHTGFRPRWILIKRVIGGTSNWIIFDTARNKFNLVDDYLYANLSNAETDVGTREIDILASGFKLRGIEDEVNTSGSSYLFLAMADVAGGGIAPPLLAA